MAAAWARLGLMLLRSGIGNDQALAAAGARAGALRSVISRQMPDHACNGDLRVTLAELNKERKLTPVHGRMRTEVLGEGQALPVLCFGPINSMGGTSEGMRYSNRRVAGRYGCLGGSTHGTSNVLGRIEQLAHRLSKER